MKPKPKRRKLATRAKKPSTKSSKKTPVLRGRASAFLLSISSYVGLLPHAMR